MREPAWTEPEYAGSAVRKIQAYEENGFIREMSA